MDPATTIGVVAHFNLLERLEPAGPGELYRARDTRHGRTVVVRVLPASGDEQADRTLLQQAESLASLSHPNAITLFASGEHDGRVFLAFERITGRSLRAEMAGRQMKVRRAVELAIQITDAVAEAHAIGFLHNGLSPDTIGITAKGHAKIPTFHLATTLGLEGPMSDRLVDYFSPEEAEASPADERSDIYSIGAVLYEMLTARRPMHRGASAPSTSNRHVPKDLDAVVLKAVAPNRDRRFQSAAEFAAALRAVLPVLDGADVPSELIRGARNQPGEGTASIGRVALTTLIILVALAAIAWWVTRS
jgi:serine/threonine protein kinase